MTMNTTTTTTTTTASHRTMAVLTGSPLSSLLLITCLSVWSVPPAESFHVPRCQLVNQTVSLEKEGCPRCHTVETTICSGNCPTKDPVLKLPFGYMYQDVCTYRDYFYRELELPDCPPGVDPVVRYLVALSCHCGRCSMDTSDCTCIDCIETPQPNFCTNDIPFYY